MNIRPESSCALVLLIIYVDYLHTQRHRDKGFGNCIAPIQAARHLLPQGHQFLKFFKKRIQMAYHGHITFIIKQRESECGQETPYIHTDMNEGMDFSIEIVGLKDTLISKLALLSRVHAYRYPNA